ncbi:MAG: bifunctional methylenetetrahydrofolate dehydrogenase/methenyltetrahydrofolate cyclohydrolase FolD [Bacillota bacterium]
MSAVVLNGTELSKKIKGELTKDVATLKTKGISPGLAVIIVDGDAASRVYVDFKKKDCAEIGIESFEFNLPCDVSENYLLELVERLNADSKVHGILCQLPLPKHICEDNIINAISTEKDVDCFHPFNVGLLVTGHPKFQPCTPAGVMELIRFTGIDVSGKECVVVGRSNIVGKPMALLLLAQNGTVTVCHSRTRDLAAVCRRADILVAAVGKADMITADMVKEGAIVIDVGVSRLADGSLCGDVKFDEVSNVASAITRVTGGVGPMTRAILMKNTVLAAGCQIGDGFK